jgi:hypothetical protein
MKTLLIISTSATIISFFSLTGSRNNDCRNVSQTVSKQEVNMLQPKNNTIYSDLMLYTVTAL